jgi:hypothetical protein
MLDEISGKNSGNIDLTKGNPRKMCKQKLITEFRSPVTGSGMLIATHRLPVLEC